MLTGGPGSGKTSLIEAAKAASIATTDEVGRAIIREQLETDGNALPWSDREAFADLMLDREIGNINIASASPRPVISDRGVADVWGYARLERLANFSRYEEAARQYRYATTVFVAPPWAEIYATDAERKQDWELAVKTCEMMVSVYGTLGYELVELPKVSVEERLAFVRAHMNV